MTETLKEKMERDFEGLEMELDALMKKREEREQAIEDLTVDELFSEKEQEKIFEDSLREMLDSITILGVEYDPIRIMKSCDECHYDQEFSYWLDGFTRELGNHPKYQKAKAEIQDDIDDIDTDIDLVESDIKTMKAEIAKLED